MKTFIIINGIVGFTLLSSCSTRPMNRLFTEPSESSVKSFEATNEAHPWNSSPVGASLPQDVQKDGTPSLEKLEVDRKEVEESLRRLRNNRASGVDHNSGVNSPAHADHGRIPSTGAGQVTKAVKKTVQGIDKEIEAYKALAGGRVNQANGILQEATDDQQEAFSLINYDKTTLLLGLRNDQNVQKQVRKLTEEIEAYELLPTERELLAVFHSLDKDFPPRLSTMTPAKNHDISTSVNHQHTPNSAMHADTSILVQHQNGASLLKNQDRPSVVMNAPEESKLEILFGVLSRWYQSLDESRLRTGLFFLATALKGKELQVLTRLRLGDRAGALEKIKSMQRTRKIALDAYEDYQARGYGTIDFENRGGYFYRHFQDQVVHYSATMKTDRKITRQRIEEIKQRLKLHEKGSKP